MTRQYPIYVIRERLSWQRIEKALKLKREYDTRVFTDLGYSPCGLSGEKVYMRIYTSWSKVKGTSSIHINRHSDGICICGSLNIRVDRELAKKAYEELRLLSKQDNYMRLRS